MSAKIHEETTVPLKWVFALLSVSATAVTIALMLGAKDAKFEAKQESHDKQITELRGVMESEIKESADAMRSIDRRLSRIEGRLEIRVPKGEQ